MNGLKTEQIKKLEEWFVLLSTYCYQIQEGGMVM
jgi:hypothetical protein